MRITCPSCKNDFVVSESQLSTGNLTTAGCPICGNEYRLEMAEDGTQEVSFGQRRGGMTRICIECSKEFNSTDNDIIPVCPSCKRIFKKASDNLELKVGTWKLSKNEKLITLDSEEMVRDWIRQGAIQPDDRLIDPFGKEHFAKRIPNFTEEFQSKREKQKQHQPKTGGKSFRLPNFEKIGSSFFLYAFIILLCYSLFRILHFSPDGADWNADLNYFVHRLKNREEPTTSPPSELTRQALTLMMKDRMESYEQATNLLEQSLILNKESPQTIAYLAECYALLGGRFENSDFRLASGSLSNLAVKLYPDKVEPYIARIRSSLLSGDFDLAKNDIETAKNIDESNDRLLLAIAAYLNEVTPLPPEELFQTAKSALSQNPGLLEAYSIMGQAWIKRGNPLQAREMFEVRLRRSENDPLAFYYLGKMEELAQNNNEAKEWFQNALRMSPRFTPARLELAQLLFHNDNQVNSAERHLRDLLGRYRKINSYENIYFSELSLLEILLESDRLSEALDLTQKFPNQYISASTTLQAKAETLSQASRLGEAISVLKNGAVQNDFLVTEMLAEKTDQSGSFDEALKLYREAIKLNPHAFFPFLNAITMLSKHDRKDEALDMANTAVNRTFLLDHPYSSQIPFGVKPDWVGIERQLDKWAHDQNINPVVLAFLGMTHLFRGIQESNRGEIYKSIDPLERAISFNRNAEFSQILLGRAQAVLKNWGEARVHFQTAIQVNPASNVSRMWIAKSKKELRSFEDAKQTFESFLSDPDWGAWVSYELGEISISQHQLKEAKNYFETSLQKDPTYTPAWKKLLSTKWD